MNRKGFKGNISSIVLKSLACLLILIGVSGCKSHKQAIDDTPDFIGETIRQSGKEKEKNKTKGVRYKIVEEAKTWLGTPYVYARSDKGLGTDCSGFVMVVFQKAANMKLPRNSAKQAEFSRDINAKEVRAGDLVFFATGKDKNKVSHVGLMLDPNKFIHASSSKGVTISEMTTPYYQKNFVKYGRVLK